MARGIRFQVEDEPLRKAEQLFRKLPKELKNDIRRQQRAQALPIWREEIAARSDITPLAQRVYKAGTSVKTGANLVLVAAGSGKKMGRGIPQNVLLRSAEFGSGTKGNYTRYHRKTKHGSTTVERRTRKGLPDPRRAGMVAVPSAARAIYRIKSLTIQTTIRKIHEAVEGG